MLKDLLQNIFNSDYVEEAEGFHHIDRQKFKKYNKIRPNGSKKLFCYVPFNSLTFSFRGKVYACTYNRDVVLGTYPQNTLEEIWNGENANLLREYMRNNDLSFGCQHCEYFFDKEKFSNLKPLVFDKYSDIEDIHYPRVLEFEMSNTCNYECQMCSGEVSSLIRKNRDKLPPIEMPYDDEFVHQLEKFIPYVKEAKFFGGEPFLIDIYYKIWDKMLEINPEIEFFTITNGSVWNNRVRSMIERGHFELAISIDSLQKEKLEKIRKHAKFERLIENIHNFNHYAQLHSRAISLSFTIQKDNWDEFPDMIEFCNKIGAYIFVSYLEYPERFSIADYPFDKLQEVREYMEKFHFNGLTGYRKHNAKCFEDFKIYVDNFLKKKNVGRYLEYRLEGHSKSGESKKSEMSGKTETELKALFESNVKIYYSKENVASLEISDFLAKFYRVLSKFNDTEQKELLTFVNLTDINTIMSIFSNTDEEQLVVDAKHRLQQA
ncbi:MAG: radical SAM protein [Chitinophagales bacterium]|nr:radical SAM protein [Chitinophagales bacterium]